MLASVFPQRTSSTLSPPKMIVGDNRGRQKIERRLIKTPNTRRSVGKAAGKRGRSLDSGDSLLKRNIYSPGASSGDAAVKFWQK